jgi:subtilase family serine protease
MAGRSRTGMWVVGVLACALLAPATASARVIGRVSPATVLHVTVTLRPRDPQALAAYATEVATPGSPVYHQYLTPAEFARRFGAPSAAIASVREALQGRGLTPGRVSAGGLSIPVTARAGLLEHGLGVSLLALSVPGRRAEITDSRRPSLGAAAGQAVESILGLSSADSPQPLLVRAPRRAARGLGKARPAVATGGPQPCPEARSAASSQGGYTSDQIASAYNYSSLYGARDTGAGETVALYELEPYDPRDVAAYQACYGTNASISNVSVDGGAGSGAGSGEAALDIENLVSLAPSVHVLVYEAPNSSSGAPGAGPYDAFSAIINQDRAQVVSVSWGECEAALGAADAAAESTLFQQAAVQGQTVVAASGDSGSEDCDGGSTIPQTQLAVDDPSSQPFVMGVGGTHIASLGPRPSESVWNDGGVAGGLLQAGAGGGGISQLWGMPVAQQDAASSLNVLSRGPTGSDCGQVSAYCREVPDVAANADPTTGYVIYWNGSGSQGGQTRGWQVIGGTSAAAPVWAALMALADASSSCHASPLGYVLPALYRAAGAAYASDFNDVQSGNNDFTGTNHGLYAAASGYDEASGLGSPNAGPLAAALCMESLRLANPGPQDSAAGASVSLRLRAADGAGQTVTLHVIGLPSGLALAPGTDRITGRAWHRGSYHVVIRAADVQRATVSESFTWTVGGATRILGAALTGARHGRLQLAFTVRAGQDSPALHELSFSIPTDLRLASRHGVRITTTRGRRVGFRARLRDGVLTIALRRGYRLLHLRLRPPAIHLRNGRQAEAPGRHSAFLSLTAKDDSGDVSSLRSRVRHRT